MSFRFNCKIVAILRKSTFESHVDCVGQYSEAFNKHIYVLRVVSSTSGWLACKPTEYDYQNCPYNLLILSNIIQLLLTEPQTVLVLVSSSFRHGFPSDPEYLAVCDSHIKHDTLKFPANLAKTTYADKQRCPSSGQLKQPIIFNPNLWLVVL